MPWSLKHDGNNLSYSKKEQALFNLLPQDGQRIDTDKLLAGLYKRGKGKAYQYPYHGRTSMTGAIRSLMDKVDRNKEPFRIMKSERRGPNPMEFWITARR